MKLNFIKYFKVEVIFLPFNFIVGIPKILYYGVEGDYNVMVMEVLGPSLEAMFRFCDKSISTNTLLLCGIQLIQRLEFIHSKNFIHRDIKPENFLVGMGKETIWST